MPRILTIIGLCLWFSGSWLCRAADDRHVVLITIDGFPAYVFWDPQASIPRIRELASEGVASEGMRVCNPTVTWPNHTTLVTGVRAAKHSVLFNGVLVRPGAGLPVRIDEERDKAELVSGETIFDVLHEHGYRTAAIDWPCTRNSEALEDNFPDVPDHLAHTTPRLRRELLAEGVLTNETDAVFERLGGTQHDEIWTRAACLALERRKPHLLLLHLLNTDGVHHLYGPQTPPSYRALSLADGYVGQVLEALDRAGIRQNTTVFVTADHGFGRAANVLQPNVLLRQKGLLEVGANNQIIKARAQAVPEGGTAMVYLTNPETRDGDRQKVLQLFSGKEGIAEIIQPERYEALGLPSPVKDPHMADLVLAAAEGYAFSGSATGEDFVVPVGPYTNRGYHGYLASDSKMDAALVIAGRGVRRGSKIGLVENVDIAPTIAQLLGQKLERADGKVLSEALLPY